MSDIIALAAESLPEPGPPPAYEPPLTPLTPILPAATVTLDELVRIERAWRREVKNVIMPELERTMRKAADSVLKDIAFQVPVLWDVSQPSAQAFLVQTENQLVGVGEDMWKRTRDELILGMQDGESIQQLSARVKGVLGSTDARARTIARTEVIGASNAGAMQQLELLGEDAPARKTWVSTHDKRTRLSHAVADGQTVDFVAPFTVGGAKLDYPGDPDAPADERINCRCTLVWHFDDVPLKGPLPEPLVASALEMFGKAGDPYVRDSHGKFAPKGGGGAGASAPSGSKKTLKPAHVDTSRLNAAESKELADIEADYKAGKIDDAKYKYKTYYVKVKASKRINKSGGAGKGTELDTKVDAPKETPGHKQGDVVTLPNGKTGVVVSTKGSNYVTVDTPDGKTHMYHKDVVKKSSDVPAPTATPAHKKGDVVVMPSGSTGVVKAHHPGNDTVEVEADGDSFIFKSSDVKKHGEPEKAPTPPWKQAKTGDNVKTPNGEGKIISESTDYALVEHPDGSTSMHKKSDIEKKLAPVGSVNVPKSSPSAGVGADAVVKGKLGEPKPAFGGGSTAPKKEFVKPSQVKETQLNSAEYDELYALTTANKAGTLSDAEFKKKAYYVKVKASKRINKNSGAQKPGTPGTSTPTKPKVSYIPSGGGSTSGFNPTSDEIGADLVTKKLPSAVTPDVLGDPKSPTRVMAHKNADITQKNALKKIQDAKNYGGSNPTGLSAHTSYTGSGYTPMNNYARTGKVKINPGDYVNMTDAQAAKKIKALDTVFDSHGIELGQPIVVNRGVRGKFAGQLKNLKPGDVITERGFISTSSKRSAPKGFQGQNGALLEIAVPPGKKVIAGTHYEEELILPRNQQLVFHGTTPAGVLQFSVL